MPTEVPDVMFAGGADADRLQYVRSLIAAGLKIALYGGYWDRHADLKPYWRGNVDFAPLRRATSAAGIGLCLVPHAKPDGKAKRTFQGPAFRGCLLIEGTPEHPQGVCLDCEKSIHFPFRSV